METRTCTPHKQKYIRKILNSLLLSVAINFVFFEEKDIRGVFSFYLLGGLKFFPSRFKEKKEPNRISELYKRILIVFIIMHI